MLYCYVESGAYAEDPVDRGEKMELLIGRQAGDRARHGVKMEGLERDLEVVEQENGLK